MSRERILEDILRGHAANLEVEPGALAAILTAPKPNADKPERSEQQQAPDSTSAQPSSAAGGPSAAAGGSIARTLFRFVGGLVVVAVIAVAAAVFYVNGTDGCPVLGPALGEVNQHLDRQIEVGTGDSAAGESERQAFLALECGEPVPSIDQLEDLATDRGLSDTFDRNRGDIEKARNCLVHAATPLQELSVSDAMSVLLRSGNC